jgi:hypothetical protein
MQMAALKREAGAAIGSTLGSVWLRSKIEAAIASMQIVAQH